MAQTPAQRAADIVLRHDAALTRYAEDVRATEELYRRRLETHAHDRDADLADCAADYRRLAEETHQLDERPPEPVKPPRTALISRGEVNRLLGLSPPDLAGLAKLLTTSELKHLLISAKARRLGDHAATLDREIGGRE